MPQRTILVADDIENQTDSGKRRSQAIRNAATFLAQRLKTGIELLYVEEKYSYRLISVKTAGQPSTMRSLLQNAWERE